MKQKLLALVTLLLSCFPLFAHADDFTTDAKQAIAVEVSTGKILYEKDSQTKVAFASVIKLLTAYLTYEAIENGTLSWDTMVPISDYPYNLTTNSIVSNIPLENRLYSVRDLLNVSLITSANSATIALAEQIAGSEPAFVDKMKAKLADWGITNMTLINTTGLNNMYLGENIYPNSQPTDENLLSATDVAIIARRLILDYPEILEITSQYSYTLDGATYYSTNQMLQGGTYVRDGVDGLKTGSSESGISFVATTTQKNMRIITVVLTDDETDENAEKRFSETNSLMNYVYQTFSYNTLVEKGQQYQNSSLTVFNGQSQSSKAVAAKDLPAIIRKDADRTVSAKFTAIQKNIDAPVQKNDVLGTLTLVDNDLIGQGYLEEQPQIEMLAEASIPTAIWPLSWWNYFIRYVNENL